jgi:3-dehydroquinate dehydratase
MHDLVKAASLALSTNDAETLERLAAEARTASHNVTTLNLSELARAAHVLTQQVQAAQTHLDLRSRVNGSVSGTYKANPWAL